MRGPKDVRMGAIYAVAVVVSVLAAAAAMWEAAKIFIR